MTACKSKHNRADVYVPKRAMEGQAVLFMLAEVVHMDEVVCGQTSNTISV